MLTNALSDAIGLLYLLRQNIPAFCDTILHFDPDQSAERSAISPNRD
jgi:hypothetical protein